MSQNQVPLILIALMFLLIMCNVMISEEPDDSMHIFTGHTGEISIL